MTAMENETKPRSTLIDSELCDAIQTLAESARRSFAGQVNYLLRLALKPDTQKAE